MTKTRNSTITAFFDSDIESVWNVVTNNKSYKWRSDLDRVEILNDGNEFIEYNKNGFAIHFYITKKEKHKLYEFDMESDYFSGSWSGYFVTIENGGTQIVFKEMITYNTFRTKFLSYLFVNLKKVQKIYVCDLKKELGES